MKKLACIPFVLALPTSSQVSQTKARRGKSRILILLITCQMVPVVRFAEAQGPRIPQVQSESSAVSLDTTIRQSVRRVLVDVVVTDAQGKAVTGLRQKDFRVFENGALQQIRSFAEASVAPGVQPEINQSGLPPSTFTNASPVPDESPLNIILWDLKTYDSGFQNTQVEQNLVPAMLYARRQVIDFLRHKPVGSRFAIIMRTDRLKLLSGFIDNSEQLALAMEQRETRTIGTWPPSIHPQPPPFNALRSDEGVLAQSRLMNRMLFGSAWGRRNRSLKDLENQWMAQSEIYDLWELARWLVALPGRKNVFWLTSSIPGDLASILEDTGAILALSRIAIYPIDWRTLTPDAIYDVTTNPDNSTKLQQQDPRTWLPQLSAQYLQDEKDRIENVGVIAEQTGGHAFFNTNDLKGALVVASEEGSHVYTLTYSPSNTKFYGERRRIKVEVAGDGHLRLSYRRSYFADSLKGEPRPESLEPPDPLAYASQFGAPTSQEILFTARVEKKGNPRTPTPDETKQFSVFRSAEMTASNVNHERFDAELVQNFVVHYSVIPTFIEIRSTERGKVVQLEFAMTAYDSEGHMIYGVHGNLAQVMSENDKNAGDSYRANQAILLPTRTAFLRVAVLDKVSGRVGSLQIPLQS